MPANRILLPINDSATTRHTLAFLLAHRERFTLPLTLLHVVDTERLAYRMIPDFQIAMIRESARRSAQQLLDEQAAALTAAGLSCATQLEFGSPRDVICQVAGRGEFALLVIGRRPVGEIRDVLFGAVANHVLHRVALPVLLV